MSSVISFESSQTPPLPIRRFSVDEYRRLGEVGVLSPDDRVELLEGWIVEKKNQRPIHGFTVRWLDDWLRNHLTEGLLVQCQLPITTQLSEPEPDLAVIRGRHTDFRNRHPSGADCELVIEVADSSLAKDRAKASIYAGDGVREYWIVNLVDLQLERYRLASAAAFGEPDLFQATDKICLEIGDDAFELPLAELIGKP